MDADILAADLDLVKFSDPGEWGGPKGKEGQIIKGYQQTLDFLGLVYKTVPDKMTVFEVLQAMETYEKMNTGKKTGKAKPNGG